MGAVFIDCGPAQSVSRVEVSLREVDGDPLEDATVRATRLVGPLLADGEMFIGKHLALPYGWYRFDVIMTSALDERIVQSSIRVIREPRITILLGVSLASCCMNLPTFATYGRIEVDAGRFESASPRLVKALPLWDNGFAGAVAPNTDGGAVFERIDFGTYIVLLLSGDVVLASKQVSVTYEIPVVRLSLRPSPDELRRSPD